MQHRYSGILSLLVKTVQVAYKETYMRIRRGPSFRRLFLEKRKMEIGPLTPRQLRVASAYPRIIAWSVIRLKRNAKDIPVERSGFLKVGSMERYEDHSSVQLHRIAPLSQEPLLGIGTFGGHISIRLASTETFVAAGTRCRALK
jgi:hypothetical protein